MTIQIETPISTTQIGTTIPDLISQENLQAAPKPYVLKEERKDRIILQMTPEERTELLQALRHSARTYGPPTHQSVLQSLARRLQASCVINGSDTRKAILIHLYPVPHPYRFVSRGQIDPECICIGETAK